MTPLPHLPALAAVLSLLPDTANAAQQNPPERPAFVADESGAVRVPVPEGWTVLKSESGEPNDTIDSSAQLVEYSARVPAVEEKVWVQAILLNGCRPTDRLQCLFESEAVRKEGWAREGSVRCIAEPRPFFTYVYAKREVQRLVVPLRARGRLVSLALDFPPDRFEQFRVVALDLADRVEIDLRPWPELPPGYTGSASASPFEIHFTDAVTKPERKDFVKRVRGLVKTYESFHGKVDLLPDQPFCILVSTRDSDLDAVREPDAPVRSRLNARWLATKPLVDAPREHLATFASELTFTLSHMRYPDHAHWVASGESRLAYIEQMCGKDLPDVDHAAYNALRETTARPGDLIDPESRASAYDFAAWCAFFRIGPTKYRRIYKAYLKDLRTTADPAAAWEENIGRLDASALFDEARSCLERKIRTDGH